MKFSPIDQLALQVGLCSVAANGFVVPAPNANVHRHGSQIPRLGGGGAARARAFRRHVLTMTTATSSENNDGLDLDPYSTPQELSDAVSDQTLQNALDTIGLKCNEGASPLDKAKLLFLTKYLPLEDIPEKYWAEPKGGREVGGSVPTDTSVAPTIAPANDTSISDASTESESDSSIDIEATDMAAENATSSIGEDDGSEDTTSIETSTSAGEIGKADGSGNATDVDTALSSEVDEPPAPFSDTEDRTNDSTLGEGSDSDGLDLDLYDSYQELCEACSDDVLRAELQRIGLKSDGTSMDMAKRLFITKYFPIDQIPEEYLEASPGAADAKGGDIGQEEAVLEASAEDAKLVTEAIDDDDECVDDNENEKDDVDEVERLEEEQRLLEMELEAVEARIGETVEADPVASTPDTSTEVNEVVEKDEQSLNEPETTKMSKATDLTEKESQTDVPSFSTASGNAQAAAAAVKEETERQRLEVERIKAERIAAEEEAAAIRREKERIAAQEEMEADEQDEYEGSEIVADEAKSIVEEDEDVVLDQATPEAASESFEMEEDQEKSDEMSNPFDWKTPGASLPPSSTLPSSNPFVAGMPPSSTLPSSNPFIAGPSKEKSNEDDASSDDEESVSSVPSSPAFSSPKPFMNSPSQENEKKENNPVVSEQAEVNVPTKEEEEEEESEFRFEAERIKAEQEAKRQELARERLEVEALASQSKDVDTKENSSEPSILSRVASAAAGTIGLGVLAVGGSLFLDGSDSGNVQSVPSVPSPPIAEVISSTDTSIGIPRASIGESARFSPKKVEDSSESAATDSPLVDESGESSNEGTTAAASISTSEEESKDDVPATESSSVSSSDAESKQELEILRSERDNEGAVAAVPSDSQFKDDVPAVESSSLGSSESEAKPEPEAVTTDTVKGDGDTSPKATALANASEEPPPPSPPPPPPPAPPKQQQQQEPTKPVETVVPVVQNTDKISSDSSPSIALPAFKIPSIDGIFPSTEKIKRIASGIDISNGAKITGVASVAALGAIGLAMQGKDEASPGKNSDVAGGIKIEDVGPVLKETNSTDFELPTPPQATTNKTSASMPFSAQNMTAQNVILNATIAKEVNGSSTKPPFDSSKSPVPSSTRPVSPDRTDKKPPASTSPPPQAFVASPGPKRVIKPIDAEIISSKKDADGDESLKQVLDKAAEAVAGAEAALRNMTETGSNSTSSAKMDTIESEEDKRIAAEFKAAKEKMEAEKMERIEKAKSVEAQFLDQERKEAAEKAKQKRAEAEKRIADARDTIRLEQARDQKAAVPNPDEKPMVGAPSGASATTNGAKAFVPPATNPPVAGATQNSSQKAVSPRPSAAEATPRQSGNNWFNEQLRRQQIEEKTGPSAFERSRKLADGTEIPPDPRAAYRSSSYYGTNVDAADGVLSTFEYAKSAFLAAFVGIWAAFPILGLHYLVFSDYTYTTFAQWEWELIAASVQSSCFGIIYRYAMRSDVNNSSLQRTVVLAAVLLKSVIRVIVPYDSDSAPFFVVLNDSMTTDLLLNGLEGLAMFTAVAVSMNWLTERRGR